LTIGIKNQPRVSDVATLQGDDWGPSAGELGCASCLGEVYAGDLGGLVNHYFLDWVGLLEVVEFHKGVGKHEEGKRLLWAGVHVLIQHWNV
jgi:hypothetical protein